MFGIYQEKEKEGNEMEGGKEKDDEEEENKDDDVKEQSCKDGIWEAQWPVLWPQH